MAGKLYKFMTPLGILAVAFGFWLWFGYGFSGGWLHGCHAATPVQRLHRLTASTAFTPKASAPV